ncbi:MAG: universal stress protein [Candidatus Vecturithrix sp.]|jgi:nucleotide-binding universal stress UspA family protein|nr:universal stress protein [Candidatus Vecturithrix sp.]
MSASALFKKILVPVDNSKYSIDAARLAMTLAQLHHSQLILLHVVDTRALETMARYGKESKEALLVKAEESGWKVLYSLEEEAVSNHVRVALTLEEGAPQRVILDVAEKYQIELIVLGKHRKTGARKDMITPTIIENAECPVLISK